MAPEVLRGEQYNFSIDWWAMGVLVHELLSGESPFQNLGMQVPRNLNSLYFILYTFQNLGMQVPQSLRLAAQRYDGQRTLVLHTLYDGQRTLITYTVYDGQRTLFIYTLCDGQRTTVPDIATARVPKPRRSF